MTTAERCTGDSRSLLREGDVHLQGQQSADTTSGHKHSGHTDISGQESGREIVVPEVKSNHFSMREEDFNTSTCSATIMSCGSAGGDICDVVGSEDVTVKGDMMMGVTEAVKHEEIMDEVVLPFELDPGDSHDLLSLSDEIEHLLDPKSPCLLSLCPCRV